MLLTYINMYVSTMKPAQKSTKPTKSNSISKQKVYQSSLFPAQKEKWKLELLESYITESDVTLVSSANKLGITKHNIANALITDANFKKAYEIARKIRDKVELMNLETVSSTNAMEPKNMVERIFRLKSLNRERYADANKQSHDIEININFGDGVSPYKRTEIKPTTGVNTEFSEPKPSKVSSDSKDITAIASKM